MTQRDTYIVFLEDEYYFVTFMSNKHFSGVNSLYTNGIYIDYYIGIHNFSDKRLWFEFLSPGQQRQYLLALINGDI